MEHTFGTLMLHRRLARDYETLPASPASMICWSVTDVMTRRLTGTTTPTWRSTEPLAPAYRQILVLFEESGHRLHARDVCQALGTGTEPRHIESARAKLKRLVSRGILAEPEPGLFTMPRPPSSPAAT